MKRWDIYAAGFILLIALVWYLAAYTGPGTGKGTAYIYVDGREEAALPLDRETSLTVTGSEGYSCVVNITSGRADVSDATCPDRLCVHQKRISREGETIVCLPARIVIEIKGTEAGTGLYDGISR